MLKTKAEVTEKKFRHAVGTVTSNLDLASIIDKLYIDTTTVLNNYWDNQDPKNLNA